MCGFPAAAAAAAVKLGMVRRPVVVVSVKTGVGPSFMNQPLSPRTSVGFRGAMPASGTGPSSALPIATVPHGVVLVVRPSSGQGAPAGECFLPISQWSLLR